jgi:hypothetical protein
VASIIVSEQTARSLIEAHASMAAAYHQLTGALRAASIAVPTPDAQQLGDYLRLFATQFPELAAVAERIETPRLYTPPPAVARAADIVAHPAHTPSSTAPDPPQAAPTPPTPPPTVNPDHPPLVNPNQVKYDKS